MKIVIGIFSVLNSGGLVALIIVLLRENIQKKKEKERIKKNIQELYLEELLKNKFVLDHIEKSCEYKMLYPRTFFASNGLFFNVINYVLENLVELNIEKNQFKQFMEIKTSLENVIVWQDEYVKETKGNLELIYDKDLIDYYIPIIKGAVLQAKRILEENENVFLIKV